MVTTFYPPGHTGGDAIYVQALARALVHAGHHVEVVHSGDAFSISERQPPGAKGAGTPVPGDDGVVVHRLHSALGRVAPFWAHQTGGPGPVRRALAAIVDRGYDALHFHNISQIGGPEILAMGRARAKLCTLHDHWMVCPMHILWKNGERACDRPTCTSCCLRSGRPPQLWRLGGALARALGHIDLLLASSEFSAVRHRAGGIDRPIEVLPLFSRFHGDTADRPPPPARPTFLFVGRITASKGIRPLVDLFAGMPDIDLVIAGDGDLRASLADGYAHLANVRFVGPADALRLADLYRGATATIIPSLAPESFGLVAVESFAFGTPVIALDSGGCGETVRSSDGGIVCTDFAALANAVRCLAGNRGLRDELGNRARTAYSVHWSEERHLASYLDKVASVLPRVR